MTPPRYRSLTTGRNSCAAMEGAGHFVMDLWADYDSNAYTFIGTRRGERWRDHAIRGDDRLGQITRLFERHSPDRFDIYFCPNAFSEPHRRAEHALPSRYAHCDIDQADPLGYDPQPNILWETSPGRFQGIWIWGEAADRKIAEQYSHALVYKDGGDKGGWSITKMLRAPGTINHKPQYHKPVVTLRVYDPRPQKLARAMLPVLADATQIGAGDIEITGLDPFRIMRRYRRKMGLQAGTLMTATRVMRPDRSGAVYLIVIGMIEAGADDCEIAAVLLVNPYFNSKWGTDLDNAEEQILRIRARLEGGR